MKGLLCFFSTLLHCSPLFVGNGQSFEDSIESLFIDVLIDPCFSSNAVIEERSKTDTNLEDETHFRVPKIKKISRDSNKLLILESVPANPTSFTKTKGKRKNLKQKKTENNSDILELKQINTEKLNQLEKIDQIIKNRYQFVFCSYINKVYLSNFALDTALEFRSRPDSKKINVGIKFYDMMTGFFTTEKNNDSDLLIRNYVLFKLEKKDLLSYKEEYDSFIQILEGHFQPILSIIQFYRYCWRDLAQDKTTYKYVKKIRESIQTISKCEFLMVLCNELKIFLQINYEYIDQCLMGQILFYLQTILYIYELNKDKFLEIQEIRGLNFLYNNTNLLRFVILIKYLLSQLFTKLNVGDDFLQTYKITVFLFFLRFKYPEIAIQFNYLELFISNSITLNETIKIDKKKELNAIRLVFALKKDLFSNEIFKKNYLGMKLLLISTITDRFTELDQKILNYKEFLNSEDFTKSSFWIDNILKLYVNVYYEMLYKVYLNEKETEDKTSSQQLLVSESC
ncbi:hypothetical protein TUBRATIS_14830 [Tubulinosema ratisbonensis]|uniref:Uncharacterized protein n=1 Tax=Tubulinosema ratisbonensis TaxID=291195 RepID=A0A437ALU1_9MICR|nr:hypothetical protein TUBRATIS_14830 [Tubulinosema ratisbonensis]